jgi:hypothetical protein
MLHSREDWEIHLKANERLIGERGIMKDLRVIRNIGGTSQKELVRCFDRLNEHLE